MRRSTVMVAFIAGLAGCAGESAVNPAPVPVIPVPVPVPPVATSFTLDGTVRSESGLNLPGVTVAILDARQAKRETSTDSTGYFRFDGVSGSMILTVSHDDYLTATFDVLVNAPRRLSIVVRLRRPADRIVEGQSDQWTVANSDVPCDPVHWDAHAPCKRLLFVPSKTGRVAIEVTWTGVPDVDFTVMSPEGAYLAYSSGARPRLRCELEVVAGAPYEIWVHAYYSAVSFALRADILP